MIGTTISHYRITEKLGEGGMGVVYRAEDTKLDRPVALKFLALHAIEDPEHKARFIREAKAAARLDHPNICSVYEIDEAEGQTFLAMAYLEGQTVKDKIAERPLKLEEALDIAIQTAQGLRAAHEKRIVHRDIKSANLMVNPQGQVKIMDFGLAQLAERSKLTETATILGTPAYMSPEQAQGQKTDRRTDLWSLGVVLYEMVTGQLPFEAERQEAVLYKIGSEEPEPVTALRAGLPMELEWIIGKCLAKAADERYQHAEDLLVDLRSLQKKLASGKSTILKTQTASQAAGTPSTSTEQIERRNRRKQTVLLGTAALGVLLAAIFAFFPLFSISTAPVPQRPLRRFSITTANLAGLYPVAISPDGEKIIYSAGEVEPKLWLRDLKRDEPRELDGTEGAQKPFWSPDSKSVGFATRTELKRISVQGGEAITVCKLPARQFDGGSWSPDGGSIVFSSDFPRRMLQVAAGGGTAEVLVVPEEHIESYFRYPHFLPAQASARSLVFSTNAPVGPKIAITNLGTGKSEVLTDGSWAQYSTSGHLVYQHGRTLWALPFSVRTLKPTGAAFQIAQNAKAPSVARDGTLVYTDGSERGRKQLVWRSRTGERLAAIGQPQGTIEGASLSPDGRHVAVSCTESGNRDIWVHNIARGNKTRTTFSPRNSVQPTWAPSGRQVAYTQARGGGPTDIFSTSADGSGKPTQLTDESLAELAPDWSEDGKYLIYHTIGDSKTLRDIWYREFKEGGSTSDPVEFLKTPFNEKAATFSPNGRFVAYLSDQSGRYEVYVRPFPAGRVEKVSVNGGTQARWSRDGRELFYVEGATLVAVSVSTSGRLLPGQPESLFDHQGLLGPLKADGQYPLGLEAQYDVSGDGQKFVLSELLEGEAGKPKAIHIVQNWFAEFRGRK